MDEVTQIRNDIKQMMLSFNQLNDTIKKVENIVLGTCKNTTPSISIINNAINTKKPEPPSLKLSPSKSDFGSSSEDAENQNQLITIKEQKRSQSGSITLHFMYNYKKILILSFDKDTPVEEVKKSLGNELEQLGYSVPKLLLSKYLIRDFIDDEKLLTKDDSKKLSELEISGHQLVFIYGISSKGSISKKSTSDVTSNFRPRRKSNMGSIGVADGPIVANAAAARRKKVRYQFGSESALSTPNMLPPGAGAATAARARSPNVSRRSPQTRDKTENQPNSPSITKLAKETKPESSPLSPPKDEFADLQSLVSNLDFSSPVNSKFAFTS